MAAISTNYDSTSTSNDVTITLASLASSSTLLVGRESNVIDNSSNNFVDVLVSGQITTGTTPTADRRILVFVYPVIDLNSGTAVYPTATATALTGADAAATFEAGQRDQLKLGAAIIVNGTSDRKYNFSFSVAQLFGGVLPVKFGFWVTHDTGVNLNATSGNHWITYNGIKYTVA